MAFEAILDQARGTAAAGPTRRRRITLTVSLAVHAAALLGGRLVHHLGAGVNGLFPRAAEPTREALASLCRFVVEKRADVGFAQDPRLVPLLGKLLHDPAPNVRNAAVVSLLAFAPDQAAPVMKANLASDFRPLFVNALAGEERLGILGGGRKDDGGGHGFLLVASSSY